jgi:hypothetical protein
MKSLIAEFKSRVLNRGTLMAIGAYVIGQLLSHNIIHTTQLAVGVQTLINDVINLLVLAGFLNNAGIGKGFKDVE